MDSEVQGDILKAIDWLRAKGIAKANSQTTRISIEGLIAIYQRKQQLTLIEVNSETGLEFVWILFLFVIIIVVDFVSRNSDFQRFVTSVALSTNHHLGVGEFNTNQLLDLQTHGTATPTTIRHLLGDITTAIRYDFFSLYLLLFLLFDQFLSPS